MKLETEFRVRLQLMQLEQVFQKPALDVAVKTLPQSASSNWIKLVQPPNPFCDNEALLLCQYSNDEWLAWVPNLGEIILNEDEFCFP